MPIPFRKCLMAWATGKQMQEQKWEWEWKRKWKQLEKCGEHEPVSWPYSHQESQISHELAPHWVHSSICKLIPGRHYRFIIVGPRVVVYRLSSSQVDGYTTGWSRGVRISHDKRVRVRRLTTGCIFVYFRWESSHLSCIEG